MVRIMETAESSPCSSFCHDFEFMHAKIHREHPLCAEENSIEISTQRNKMSLKQIDISIKFCAN